MTLTLLCGLLGAVQAADVPNVNVGEPAILFALPLVNDDYEKNALPRSEIALAEFAGTAPAFPKQAVVLFFFSRASGGSDLPALSQVAKQNKDVQVIAIAVDGGEVGALANWVDEQDLAIPVVRDSYQVVKQRYGLSALPMTFVVDPEGRVASIGNPTGADLGAQLEMQIAPFLITPEKQQ